MIANINQGLGASTETVRHFLKVVDAGGIEKAAPNDVGRQAMYVRCIRELENHWGFKLTREYRGEVVISRKGIELAEMMKRKL
jgi:hypothetical protein